MADSLIKASIPVTCKCEFHAVRPQKYSFLSFSQEHDGGRPYMCTPLRSNSKHRCNCWLTDSVLGPPILHFNPFVARTRNGEKPTSNSVWGARAGAGGISVNNTSKKERAPNGVLFFLRYIKWLISRCSSNLDTASKASTSYFITPRSYRVTTTTPSTNGNIGHWARMDLRIWHSSSHDDGQIRTRWYYADNIDGVHSRS